MLRDFRHGGQDSLLSYFEGDGKSKREDARDVVALEFRHGGSICY